MQIIRQIRLRYLVFLMLISSPLLSSNLVIQHKVDSLLNLARTTNDSNLPRLYYNLSYYLKREDHAKSKYYAFLCLDAAKKRGRPKMIGLAELNMGRRLIEENKGDSCEWMIMEALSHLLPLKDSVNLPDAYLTLGNAYMSRGMYDKALQAYLSGLPICEKQTNRKRTGNVYNNIAEVYNQMKNYERSLEYYSKAADAFRAIKDTGSITIALGNIASVHANRGELDKAIAYDYEAIEMAEKMGDEEELGFLEINIGQTFSDKSDYRKAEEYLQKSLVIRTKLKDESGIAFSLSRIASNHQRMGDPEGAVGIALKAIGIARPLRLRPIIKACYSIISDAYFKLGKYKESSEYRYSYSSLSDSIYSDESLQQINEMQAKYESAEKERQIKDLEKNKIIQNLQLSKQESENKRQRVFLALVGIGFVLVVALAFFIFRGYRQKQKANEIITLQKQEVENQKGLIEVKNKEILDSITYAKRIQGAILPPDKYVKSLFQDSFILYKPKDIVSGDIYWLEQSGDRIFVAAVDCTGHGVPGAMVSVVAQNNLNRCVKEFGLTAPGQILDKLNDLVEEIFSKSEDDVKDGMDISLCVFSKADPGKLQLEWAGANNPVWIFRDGTASGIREINGDKQPIGKHASRKQFTSHQVDIEKGEMVYIFTDGFADQFGGPSGKKFKYKSLHEQFASLCSLPVNEQKIKLDQVLNDWKGNLEQVDDVLIVGIRV
jgi:serine phosphatase RsbU (regulator of sigma subunit)